MDAETPSRWLLLIHQLPPNPSSFRARIGRRLYRLGAVAIKNSVYVLPSSEGRREQLEWVLREVLAGGGDGSICEARFLDGLRDDQVEGLLRSARESDYAELLGELKQLGKQIPRKRVPSHQDRARLQAELTRAQVRFDEISEIDFVGATGRDTAQALLSELTARFAVDNPVKGRTTNPAEAFHGRTWVTRQGIHVDRMASAWLIRRFIDPEARFKFVVAREHKPADGELRFDMFDGEFTHEGDQCTFEVLVARAGLTDPGLSPIAEMVHDLDVRDGKFSRPETAGFEVLVNGIALAHASDEARLTRASAALDDLYAYYARKLPR